MRRLDSFTIDVLDNDGRFVARASTTDDGPGDVERMEANAALIAVSPAIVEGLDRLRAEEQRQAGAAILARQECEKLRGEREEMIALLRNAHCSFLSSADPQKWYLDRDALLARIGEGA
jgi:hypothetical protein